MAGGAYPQVAGGTYPELEPEWVDEVLLAGAADDVCLHLGEPVSRAELRRLVAERHRLLADAGRQPFRNARRRRLEHSTRRESMCYWRCCRSKRANSHRFDSRE